MPLSPTGVIPENLMDRSHKKEVIRLLQSLPLPADTKSELLIGWGLTVGQRITGQERKAVFRTGVDSSYDGTGTYVNPNTLT